MLCPWHQWPWEPKGRVYNPLLQQPSLPFSPLFMDIDWLAGLRHTYKDLERCVQQALNTQVGDNDRLAEIQNEVLLYNKVVEQVRRIQPTKRQNNLNSPSDVACPPLLTWRVSEPLYSSAPNVLWASACAIQSLLETASRLFLGSQRTNRKHYYPIPR